ncbi:HPP family protein [Vaginella massiliensis]|uniref:CBS domain-containing protein n=1 Tax=Vaginella massiliensis TaxID=1816680 RepID=UPI000839814F|nr:CBS domain-containing protein [Vaginella massiliensis]
MKQRVPVAQIMSKNVIAVNPTKKLSEVDSLFKEYNIRHIPVTDGSKLIGVMSKSDLAKLVFRDPNQEIGEEMLRALYDNFALRDVMVSNPVTVTGDTHIKEVAEILANQTFHSLPVVDENGDLIGIVTTTDLLNYLLEQY